MKDAKKKNAKKGWICPNCQRGCNPDVKSCDCISLSPRVVYLPIYYPPVYYPPVYPHPVPYRYAPLPATPWIYANGSSGIGIYNGGAGYTVAQAGEVSGMNISNAGGTLTNNAGQVTTITGFTVDSLNLDSRPPQ